jgi:hypothetical protein
MTQELKVDKLKDLIVRVEIPFGTEKANTNVYSANFQSDNIDDIMSVILSYMKGYDISSFHIPIVLLNPNNLFDIRILTNCYSILEPLDLNKVYKFIETTLATYIYLEKTYYTGERNYLLAKKVDNTWYVYFSHQTEYGVEAPSISGWVDTSFLTLEHYVEKTLTKHLTRALNIYQDDLIEDVVSMYPTNFTTDQIATKLAELILSDYQPDNFKLFFVMDEDGEEVKHSKEFKGTTVWNMSLEIISFLIKDNFYNRELLRICLTPEITYSPLIKDESKEISPENPLYWEINYN